MVVNQAAVNDAWVTLGIFFSGPTGRITVHVTDRGDPLGSTLVGADALRLVRSGPPDSCGPPPSVC